MRVVGLVLAVGLVPLLLGIVFVQRGADGHADDTLRRALTDEARDQAASLEGYFERSRSLVRLAARDTALRRLLATPGGRRAQLRATGDLDRVNAALNYLERLYPAAIGEACLIDGRGRELARVVRGDRAPRSDLSLEEEKAPFFAPTLALRPGQVFQAAPYESPDTGEWVISNSTPVPGVRVPGGALLHFEVTVESFRRQAAANARRFAVAVLDAKTGRVAFDSLHPQRRGQPLGPSDAMRFAALRGQVDRPGLVELPGTLAAVRPLAAEPGNANRWIVVVTPAAAPAGGLAGAVLPLVSVTVALLLGVGLAVARRYQRVSDAALTDPVTELPNRRAFVHEVDRLAAHVTSALPLSLLVLDLEALEQVNATEGHASGDLLLRRVADLLRERRPHDAALFRLPGSQFALAVRFGAWDAFGLASELHEKLQERQLAVRIGVSEHEPDWRAEELLRAGDVAAAEARRTGRGVLVHTPGLDTAPERPSAQHQHALAVALARAVDAKDAYTRSHCETVAELSALIATELGLDAERVARVRLAGLVHDVGKIGVPDAILNKPARLTDDEFQIIKAHADAGHRILAGTDLAAEAEWVRHHHERVDGRGYPDGVHGDQLALEARILHVADAYEAMTSDRPYRAGMAEQDAIAELERHSGTQFDPSCVAALVRRVTATRDDAVAAARA
jgi:diguanylate cyclase (GGDEF)-like protein